jgi:uncharacterized membrane protein YqgA involved in biofilm formation
MLFSVLPSVSNKSMESKPTQDKNMYRSRGFSFMDNIIALCLLSTMGVLVLLQQGKLVHNMHGVHVRHLATAWLNDFVESFSAGGSIHEIPRQYKLTTRQSGHIITFVLYY